MTERLDRLERRSLHRPPPAGRDRRSVLVELTPAGRGVIDRANVDMLDTQAALLDALSPRDRASLARLLAKLAAQMEHDEATRASRT